MALNSGFDELNTANSTFSDWLNKTNEMIVLMREDVVTANTSGALTSGDAILNGTLVANTLVVHDELRGGDYTTNADLLISTNTVFQDTAALVTIHNDLDVYGDAVVSSNLTVNIDSHFVGDVLADSTVTVNGTASDLIIQGANISFTWGTSGTDATITSSAAGDLIIDVDKNNEGASSKYELRVDNTTYVQTVAGGNTTFFDTAGDPKLFIDTTNDRVGINRNDPLSALDVVGTARVDELIVDGGLTSNAYIGNADSTGHSHYVNIRKGGDVSSGIVWTRAGETDVVIEEDATESLIVSVNHSGNASLTSADFYIKTDGETNRFRIDGPTGDLSFYNDAGTVEEVKWDASANNLQLIDNVSLSLGSSDDLQIYHNGTHSYIDDKGTGNLYVRSNAIELQKYTGETLATFTADGSVALYHDNSQKIQTTSSGIDVTGLTVTDTLEVQGSATFDGTGADALQWVSASDLLNFNDSVKATFGTDGDMSVYHTGTTGIVDSLNLDIVANTSLDIKTNALIIESASGENYITGILNGAVELYYDNVVKLVTATGGIVVTGNVVSDGFIAGDGEKVQLGASQDLQIFHEATGNSIIQETGSGSLVLKGNNVIIESTTGSDYFTGTAAGAAVLYHAGNAKITTTSGGIDVTGLTVTDTLEVQGNATFDGSAADALQWVSASNILNFNDSVKATYGTDGDMSVYHTGVTGIIDSLNLDIVANTSLDIKTNALIIESASGENYITSALNGAVELYYDNNVKLVTATGGIVVTGNVVSDGFIAGNEEKIQLGSAQNLQIYHETSGNSVIENTTSGTLNIRGDVLVLEDSAGNNYFDATSGGAATIYYSGDTKLETTATGINVTGLTTTDTLEVQGNATFDGSSADAMQWEASNNLLNFNDSVKATFGTSNDLQIYHNGTNSYIENGTGSLLIDGAQITIVDGVNNSALFIPAGATTLYHAGAAKIATTSTGVDITGLSTTDTLEVQGNATFDGSAADALQWVSASNLLNFNDSVKATFGTDGDMSVYHTGATGIIDSLNLDIVANTTLDIKTNALIIESAAGENYITATLNGAVDLYYDNNVKLVTAAGGVVVTGNVVSDGFVGGDGDKLQLGASQDLQIFHEATGNSIIQETGSGSLVLKGNNVIIESTTGSDYFTGVAGGAATLYHAGNAKLETSASGVTVTGNVTASYLKGSHVTTTQFANVGTFVQVGTYANVTGDVTVGGDLHYQLNPNNYVDLIPELTTGQFLGNTSNRWEGYFNDIDGKTLTIDTSAEINNLLVTGSLTVNTGGLELIGTTTLTNLVVTGTANIEALDVNGLVANGAAFIGGDGLVNSSGDTVIDAYPKSQSRGLKYIIEGHNDDAASAYAIEIILAHNGSEVFYTRYGEVSNAFNCTITPRISADTFDIELVANCPSGAVSNTHVFNIVRIETR